MTKKLQILFLGLVLPICAFILLIIFEGAFDLEVSRLESPNGEFVAYHRIAADEAGPAPYSDYVVIRHKKMSLGVGSVKEAQFLGYCGRGEGGFTMRWENPNHLLVSCRVLACGIVRTVSTAVDDEVQISYSLDHYDPNVQHLKSDSCNP